MIVGNAVEFLGVAGVVLACVVAWVSCALVTACGYVALAMHGGKAFSRRDVRALFGLLLLLWPFCLVGLLACVLMVAAMRFTVGACRSIVAVGDALFFGGES